MKTLGEQICEDLIFQERLRRWRNFILFVCAIAITIKVIFYT